MRGWGSVGGLQVSYFLLCAFLHFLYPTVGCSLCILLSQRVVIVKKNSLPPPYACMSASQQYIVAFSTQKSSFSQNIFYPKPMPMSYGLPSLELPLGSVLVC